MDIDKVINGTLALYGASVPSSLIEKAKEDAGDGANDDLVLWHLIPILFLSPTDVREGDFSISFDKKMLYSYYLYLSNKLGKEPVFTFGTSIVEDKSYLR